MSKDIHSLEEVNKHKYTLVKSLLSKTFATATKCNYMYTIIKCMRLFDIKPDPVLIRFASKLNDAKRKIQLKKRDDRVIEQTVRAEDLYQYVCENNKPLQVICMFSILQVLPIRISEFHNMSFSDDGVHNYIDLEKKVMVIREHKNGVYERVIPLTEQCLTDLKKYKELSKSELLFPFKNKRQLQNMFCQQVKVFKQKTGFKNQIGIHELRAQREQDNMKKLKPGMSSKELQEVVSECKKMGHSVETALTYYTAPVPSVNIVRILDQRGGEEHAPDELYVKTEDGGYQWVSTSSLNPFKHLELLTKYKQSL